MKKNILFIGGSSGIGLETIKLLHEKHNLIVACRTDENLGGLNIKYLNFDVLKDELDLEQIPEILDGFVYFPGSINLRPFRGLKLDTFEEDLNINFLCMVKTLQKVLNNLKQSNSSSVVLYSTVAVKVGMPFHTSVSASKGAIEGFAKSLAAELAPKIRVNAIAPGPVPTDNFNDSVGVHSEEETKALLGMMNIPLKRLGTPEDIGASVVFMASSASSWITGQCLYIDGGMWEKNKYSFN